MLKWGLIALLVLVGLGAVVILVGLILPRDHTASSSIALRQSPASVWMVVRDLGSTADWWDDVARVERVDDAQGREAWRHHLKTGPLTLLVVEDDPPRRLVTRIDVPDDAAFGGTWTYAIDEMPDGSRLTVTEDGYINNPVYRFMASVFFGMHGTMDSYLRALGRRFDEEVVPTHSS